MLWVLGFGVVVAVAAQSNQLPKTGFSCNGRTTGYYADVESGCQVYHMCDGLGRQFSYTCPNATLFQQRMLICDHWYMVNCSKSVDDYAANLRIGQKEMPFVDDSESNPYHRTPRPDLLSHPSQREYDIIYRTGRAQLGTNLNLVGGTSTTDEPAYSLPSHWSTQFTRQSSTSKAIVSKGKKNSDTSGTIKGKPILPGTATDPPVNFKSLFKNTTPVFPGSVDVTTVSPVDAGLVPPLPYQSLSNGSVPTSESPGTASTISVNFKSEFKATTPVYPKSVDITSEEPSDAGVLPPPSNNSTNETQTLQLPSLDFLPPRIDTSFDPANRSQDLQLQQAPSKFYQPPRYEPDFTEAVTQSNEDNNSQKRRSSFKALDSNEWEDLRKKFLIPDYEFPLESVSRPSYDSVLSSFQVGEKKK